MHPNTNTEVQVMADGFQVITISNLRCISKIILVKYRPK
jgi:hypothetical protein